MPSDDLAAWWKATGEAELRQILFWRWDPLGVADLFPNTADEYDGYAPQVVQALRRGASETELIALLTGFERDAMGITPAAERLRELVGLLTTWFDNSLESWRRARNAEGPAGAGPSKGGDGGN